MKRSSEYIEADDESIIDYVIWAEVAMATLHSTGETLEDVLLVAMVLKGLRLTRHFLQIRILTSHWPTSRPV